MKTNNDKIKKLNKYFTKVETNYKKAVKYFDDEEYDSCRTELKLLQINIQFLDILLSNLKENLNE